MCAIYDPTVPNHYYAAPNKFYESLALGKPLIMARNTGMASVVAQNGLGEVIDYNEASLNQALDRLIADKSGFPELAQRAKTLYREQYSWPKMEDKIVKLYNDIEEK